MKTRKKSSMSLTFTRSGVIVAVKTPRKMMGWPCFHCGRTLAKCRKKKCCKKCKGKDSH